MVTATASGTDCDKIGIGGKGGKGGICGTVTIKAGATVNSTKYTSDHVGPIK